MIVVDPSIYPIIFSLDKRQVIFSDNETVTTTFQKGGGEIINAFYGYSESYFLYADYSSTKSFIQSGKLAVLEIFGNSIDIDSLSPIIKVWIDDTSFISIENLKSKDFRHGQWIQSETLASVFLSSSLGSINPVEISGIKYYPKYSAGCRFFPDYFSVFTPMDFTITPGNSNEFSIIDVGNYGIMNLLITLTPEWFYDAERSIPVSSIPSYLEKYIPFSYSARFFYLKPSKFSTTGSLTKDGLCVFSNIVTKDFVLNNGLDYGFLRYSYIKDNKINIGREDQVVVDRNGYCAKVGKIGKIYAL